MPVNAELGRIREQGYAVMHGERVLGLTAISAPITECDRQVRHCLTVTVPTVRLQPREREVVKLVTRAAADISRRLGAEVRSVVERRGLLRCCGFQRFIVNALMSY